MRRTAGGFTLAELLAGIAITGILIVPLANMLQAGVQSTRVASTTNDSTSDARFALSRIAARATAITTALPVGAPVSAATWFGKVGYVISSKNELVETDTSVTPKIENTIASDVIAIKLTTPEVVTGFPLMTIELTFLVDGMPVVRRRTVRIGGPQ